MHHAVALLIALMQPSVSQPDYVSLFTPLEYRYTNGGYHERLFRYRLFVPTITDPSEKFPLIVWLHGYGERGDDNVYQLRWLDQLIFRAPWERDRYPFFLLAVQCPSDNGGWLRQKSATDCDDMVNVVTAILEKTLRDYAIDPTRVYLTGLSGGGSGCWQLVLRHPKYFAAVAPLASKGVQSAQLDKLKKIPIWAFHSDEDAGPPIRFVRDTVTAIREAGGNAHLTEIESKEHDCWTRAFNDYHLLDWLLAQRRGGPAWQWWQVGLQIGIPVAVIVAAWQMKKRRRRATE